MSRRSIKGTKPKGHCWRLKGTYGSPSRETKYCRASQSPKPYAGEDLEKVFKGSCINIRFGGIQWGADTTQVRRTWEKRMPCSVRGVLIGITKPQTLTDVPTVWKGYSTEVIAPPVIVSFAVELNIWMIHPLPRGSRVENGCEYITFIFHTKLKVVRSLRSPQNRINLVPFPLALKFGDTRHLANACASSKRIWSDHQVTPWCRRTWVTGNYQGGLMYTTYVNSWHEKVIIKCKDDQDGKKCVWAIRSNGFGAHTFHMPDWLWDKIPEENKRIRNW